MYTSLYICRYFKHSVRYTYLLANKTQSIAELVRISRGCFPIAKNILIPTTLFRLTSGTSYYLTLHEFLLYLMVCLYIIYMKTINLFLYLSISSLLFNLLVKTAISWLLHFKTSILKLNLKLWGLKILYFYCLFFSSILKSTLLFSIGFSFMSFQFSVSFSFIYFGFILVGFFSFYYYQARAQKVVYSIFPSSFNLFYLIKYFQNIYCFLRYRIFIFKIQVMSKIQNISF